MTRATNRTLLETFLKLYPNEHAAISVDTSEAHFTSCSRLCKPCLSRSKASNILQDVKDLFARVV
jgi:hypothetical protein